MKFLDTNSIGNRVVMSTAIPAFGLLLATVVSLMAFSAMNTGVGRINAQMTALTQLKQLNDAYSINILDAVNSGYAGFLDRGDLADTVTSASTQGRAVWSEYSAAVTSDEARSLIAEMTQPLAEVDEQVSAMLGQLENLSVPIQMVTSDYQVALPILLEQPKQLLRQLYELELVAASREKASVESLYGQLRKGFFLIGVVVLALASWLGLSTYRAVVGPMAVLTGRIREIEEAADLSIRIDVESDNEVGQAAEAFNRMLVKFQATIGEVSTMAQQLNGSTADLARTVASSSDAATQQQTETETISTAMKGMSDSVNEVASNAANAAGAAEAADVSARQGMEVVEQAVSSIRALATEVETASEVIRRLEKDSENIGSVMDVIRDIAEQTNLLALNAAIEAARAGEQGRGFAVVADEVRTLASRTQQSTEEIQQMIENLQKGTAEAVKVMAQGRTQATTSVEQAGEVGVKLEDIAAAIANINVMNSQIAAAADEQASVSADIQNNLNSMNDMAVHTAQDSQTSMSASQGLSDVATNLAKAVSQFHV